MIARISCLCAGAALVLAHSQSAAAQTPRLALSGGYAVTRATDQTLPRGWHVGIALNLNGRWRIAGEVNGADKTERDDDLGGDVRLLVQSLGAGPRWAVRAASRIVPFVQVLAGAARVAAGATLLDRHVGDSSTKLMLQPGGGVDVKVNERLGLVGQADYRRVFVDEANGRGAGENQLRAFVGLRIGF